jgi:hypothetical protein
MKDITFISPPSAEEARRDEQVHLGQFRIDVAGETAALDGPCWRPVRFERPSFAMGKHASERKLMATARVAFHHGRFNPSADLSGRFARQHACPSR